MSDVPTLCADLEPDLDEDPGCDVAQRVEELTDALAARDMFIAAIGTELRKSLAPLVLLAEQFEQLSQTTSPAAMQSRTALLTRYLRNFTTTIDRVIEVGRLREGRLSLELARVDMAEVVREVAAYHERQATASGVELRVDAPTAMIGNWDRARLKQIVSNLVSNAIRYAGAGNVEITLVARDPLIELSIRDHGLGILPADLPGIFDRFDHRLSQQAGGFGIGLFVVKTLCRAMGGDAGAENAVGGGARFTVILPRGV